jgi:signal transduction histidine kinase
VKDNLPELAHLEEIAQKLTEGKLSVRVDLPALAERDDAVGRLGRSLNQLAVTLEANLTRLERRLRQLWKLIQIERDLAVRPNIKDLLFHLPEAAAEILGADVAGLTVSEQPDLDALLVEWPKTEATPLALWLRQNTAEVGQDGIPRRFKDNARGMAVPLEVRPVAGGDNGLQIIGALGVANRDPEKAFDGDDQMLLFALAGSAGLAIERSRLLAESEQSRLRALMESMKEGVILVEAPTGKIRMANAAARHLLSWSQEANFLSSENLVEARLLALANQVALVPEQGGEEELILGNRTVRARASVSQSLTGQYVGCVITLLDTTLQRQTERLREDLSAMIVHDLRTPLTVIIGALETLTGLPGAREDAELQQEMVEMGLSGANSLLGMVNTLLDISRLENGEMPLERAFLDFPELAGAAGAQVANLAKRNNVTLRLTLTPNLSPVWADREKLQRILVNLLGNAIKFTPPEGEITISACDDSAQGWMLISVTDTGEGVPEEYLDRIFDKFEQVASRKAGRKMSTGLGLTFCKLAVEAQGGKIWVESPAFPQAGPDSPKGSRFTFTLPTRER